MNAATTWPFPGLVWGSYPQHRPAGETAVRRRARWSTAALRGRAQALAAALEQTQDLQAGAANLRAIPVARRDDSWLDEALVLAARAMLVERGVRPYWQQLMAARALLDQRLVEMDTGEGKTVAIALAAAAAALAGTPVHVLTANEYLAQRDAQALAPFYARLGLGVSAVTQSMQQDERQRAYAEAVTYCTAKELAFDYLRDSLLHPTDLSPLERGLRACGTAARPVLRGLCMALLDEADTLLVDEARVPLVLSRAMPPLPEEALLQQALATARVLREGKDYAMEPGGQVRLLPSGSVRVACWPPSPHPLLGHPQHRASVLATAVVACHHLHRDRDYVVLDGQVLLVDETTGRAAPGRAWSRGLQQLVELKEGVAPTGRTTTMAQITFQRFFPRYLRLAGISGTLRGAGAELRAVYGLSTLRVPPRRPRQVVHLGTRLYADSAALWDAVAGRAAALQAAGRPVLVGTETVQQSEALAAVLRARGLPHAVLHARQDREENAIIARAGEAGRITVATSMAGRGADIPLDAQVQTRGGLHVVLCQLNGSARIDRQFLGRAGRQGQPGSCEVALALDFDLPRRWLPAALARMAARISGIPGCAWTVLRAVQALEGLARARQRVQLARATEAQEREMAFDRAAPG